MFYHSSNVKELKNIQKTLIFSFPFLRFSWFFESINLSQMMKTIIIKKRKYIFTLLTVEKPSTTLLTDTIKISMAIEKNYIISQ